MEDQALRKFELSKFVYFDLSLSKVKVKTATQRFTQAEIVSVKIENKSSVIKTN